MRDCGKQTTFNDLVLFDEVDTNEIFKKFSSEDTQRASIAKTNRPMKFQTHKADCCENETDSIKSFYRKYFELLNVKLGDINNDG